MRRAPGRAGATLAEALVALSLLALLAGTALVAARGGLGCHRDDALRVRAEIGRLAALLMATLRDDLRSAIALDARGDFLDLTVSRPGRDGAPFQTVVRYEWTRGKVSRFESGAERAWDFGPLVGEGGAAGLAVVSRDAEATATLVVSPAGWPSPVRLEERVITGLRIVDPKR